MSISPRCRYLVLDAGPLLSLSPLRGLAATYLTVPQVLEELKDKRAREHLEKLGLSAGVKIEIRSPSAVSLSHVIQFAKKTGDYSVLSHADLSILALTYDLDVLAKSEAQKKASETVPDSDPSSLNAERPIEVTEDESVQQISDDLSSVEINEDHPEDIPEGEAEDQPLDVEEPSQKTPFSNLESDDPIPPADDPEAPLYDDPSDEDDGDGEWITPSNVALHKSRALDLLPAADASRRAKQDEAVVVGCMTADFAMQNVLLQMGLSLVGVEGKRIQKVKTWVLRCHACFKICKDNSKKFCPSCGNPTLLRASVTIAAPGADANAPVMQVHLKKNFQFKTRGTKYSIPAPKPGSAKRGPGEGLILREDQLEYMRAKKLADGKKERVEQKMVKGLMASGGEGGVSVGSWMDPDWMPDIMSASAGGKGRTVKIGGRDGDMPAIGYGRKNPNERKRRK